MAENSIKLDSRLRGNDDGAGNNGYQAYPEYKDSGVEWLDSVPTHWDIKRFGQFFEERREKVSDKDFPPLSVTLII